MKDILGYEGLYSIKKDGRVWSHPKGGHKGKFLLPVGLRYCNVVLCKNCKTKRYSVHRLVATTYLPNPNNHPIVRHLDSNPFNNHVSNLVWDTQSANVQQTYDEGRNPTTEKMRQARSKTCKFLGVLNRKKVMQLTKEGVLCKIYDSATEAGRITGLFSTSISLTARGKQKTAGGYCWKYINS